MSGKLTIITGPMFSGKTTELLRLYERKVIAEVPCLLIKYKGDNRYSESEVTSHQLTMSSPAINASTIAELFNDDIVNYDTVFIDEIQFFPDKEQIYHLLTLDIDVVVSGLNGDWQRKMFPGMSDLFAMAYDIKMLQSICGFCKSENACYTGRISGSTDIIQIGGHEIYRACCLYCHDKHVLNLA
jgi:thymidine kinase